MSTPQNPSQSSSPLIAWLRPNFRWIFLVVVLVATLVPNWRLFGRAFEHFGFEPHAPDWALAARLSWVIKLHIIGALTAFAIGLVILLQRKGSRLHKTLGWAWVIAMATTAVSSLFIVELNGGMWSWIHLLSGWTLIGLPMGIYAIRRRNVKGHQRAMTGMFLGGLVVAGALTFIPGRFFYMFFFG